MTERPKRPGRLGLEMLELAAGMESAGVIDKVALEKITLRHLGTRDVEIPPLTPDEIREMRQQAHMSQAVFARHLNLTVGYVSQLERGGKRPAGAALALLDVIRRKGIEAIL